MAPVLEKSGVFAGPLARTAKAAVVAAGPGVAKLASREVLSRRGLAVTSDSQRVTLGVIAAYIVAIALLWNLPFVRWSLWPFKVRALVEQRIPMDDEPLTLIDILPDAGHRLPRV